MRAAIWVLEADSVVVRVRVSGDWWKSLKGGGGVVGRVGYFVVGVGFWVVGFGVVQPRMIVKTHKSDVATS